MCYKKLRRGCLHHRSSHWDEFCKKSVFLSDLHVMDMSWSILAENIILKGYCLFFSGHFTRDKNRIIIPGIHLFWCKNKFRSGTLPNIINYSTERLDLQGHCKYFPVGLLRIKRNSISFSGRKQVSQRNTSISQENRYIITRILNFTRLL